ncbi:MAG: hypothetical protein AAFN92_13625 [Bacteroidota bacterium]
MSLYAPAYTDFLLQCQHGVPLVFTEAHPRTHRPSVHLEHEHHAPAPLLAYARLDAPTGRLLVHFLRHSIRTDRHQGLFFGGYCQLSRLRYLSPAVVRALGLSPGILRLRPGNYPLLIDEHFYTVSLPLLRADHEYPHSQPARLTA